MDDEYRKVEMLRFVGSSLPDIICGFRESGLYHDSYAVNGGGFMGYLDLFCREENVVIDWVLVE